MSEPVSGSLVAETETEDVERINLEGARIFSSIADLHEALTEESPHAGRIGFVGAAVGLEALNATMNPLGALTSAGIGWLIEHVWFLHEPLDHLAGDPTQITAQARTWHNAGVAISTVAGEYRAQVDGLSAWTGAAADAYRRTAHDHTAALEIGSAAADRLGQVIIGSGAAVGTVRALIRDAIADFVARVILWALGSAAAAWLTAGGSLVALVAAVITDAATLAMNIARRISRLLDELAAAGDDAVAVAATLRGLAADLRRLQPPQAPGLEMYPLVPKLIETGKQSSTAEQEERRWPG
ncbi:MAG: WXG100 family type VII secretion target [Pseudonocardia sp.]